MSILIRRDRNDRNANTLLPLDSFDQNVKDSLDFIFVQDRITKWMKKYGHFILWSWIFRTHIANGTLSLLIAATFSLT